MKAQSAIEFLSTYGFLFLMLGITLSIIAFFVFYPKSALPQQCGAFSGPTCVLSSVYSNLTTHYTLVTILMQNTQPVPINMTNITVSIKSTSTKGTCTPFYLVPGQYTTCVIYIPMITNPGALIQGFYSFPAKFCNSALGNINNNTCNFDNVTYSGYFSATATTSKIILFSVQAVQGPTTQSWPTPQPSTPGVLSNWKILQNGDWATTESKGQFVYTWGAGYSSTMFGYPNIPFPSSVSTLSNGHVACSSPYNSTFSTAYTTLYLPSATTVDIREFADDFIDVYYKTSTSVSWTKAFSGNQWPVTSYTTPNGVNALLNGPYENIAVLWANVCGGGEQDINMSQLPQ